MKKEWQTAATRGELETHVEEGVFGSSSKGGEETRMMKTVRWKALLAVGMLATVSPWAAVAEEENTSWTKLMDGKSFDGWKIAEPEKKSWSVEDGAFIAHGDRSHLFYVGDKEPFVNFELKVDVKTTSGSNGGIYLHTAWQESGWPKAGYEIQVNQTHSDWRKTGSIYAVNDVKVVLMKDDEWYTYHIIVQGKQIIVKLNDRVVNDWTEEPDRKPGTDFTRILSSGTFALQAHDPKSVVQYRNIQVKRLP